MNSAHLLRDPTPTHYASTLAIVKQHPLWLAWGTYALGAPSLLAFNMPPSATFLNQAIALIGWGAFLAVMTLQQSSSVASPPATRSTAALQVALGAVLLAALAAPLWAGAPWTLALPAAGLLAASMLTAHLGSTMQRSGHGVPAFAAVCAGLVVAGVATALVGIVQVYFPAWADGVWIAHTHTAGRAVSNMRQPNHMSSLLLWALVATVWWAEAALNKTVWRWISAAAAALMVLGLVLSASRTGALGVLVLALWGLIDKRLSPRARWGLVLLPVVYGLMWWLASWWGHHSHQVLMAESRFSTHGDISSSRFGIWSNTLALIQAHPWSGVGFGELNFAWTLTPFPGRPGAFFDHAHNLPLHLAAELGLPLAGLVLGLLLWAFWGVARRAWATPDAWGVHRAVLLMVLMVLMHSQLEYPLWYAHFLLPTAFLFGLGGAAAPDPAPEALPTSTLRATRPWFWASLLVLLAGVVSIGDYMRVVAIFGPPAHIRPEEVMPLKWRVAQGQKSWFFGHHADYAAAALSAEEAPADLSPFVRAPHYLLDARLQMLWAQALHASGQLEKARYVAQRLQEFNNPYAEEFFKPCTEPHPAGNEPLPFQCTSPSRSFSHKDFR